MKQFFFRLFTVLVLAIACTLLIQQRNWLWLCVIVPSFLVSIGWFYRLYTFNTRKIAFLLDAIENDDPAVRFYEHASPGKKHLKETPIVSPIAYTVLMLLISRITIILLGAMLLFRDIRMDSIKISLRCLLIMKNEI